MRVPGSDQPVKFGEYLSGYVSKADLTRMRQQDRTAFDQERTSFQQERQRAEQLLLQQADHLAQAMSNRGQQVPDWLTELQQQQYLDGPSAAKLVNRLMREGVGPVYQKTAQMEQAMGLLMQQIKRQQEQIQTFQSRFQSGEDDSSIGQAMKLAGLSSDNEAARDWFKTLYTSHEGAPGEDYRSVFPQWAVDRWQQHVKLVRDLDRQQADQGRAARLPGRGGQVASLNPLPERDDLSPAEIAALAWERTRGQGPT